MYLKRKRENIEKKGAFPFLKYNEETSIDSYIFMIVTQFTYIKNPEPTVTEVFC